MALIIIVTLLVAVSSSNSFTRAIGFLGTLIISPLVLVFICTLAGSIWEALLRGDYLSLARVFFVFYVMYLIFRWVYITTTPKGRR